MSTMACDAPTCRIPAQAVQRLRWFVAWFCPVATSAREAFAQVDKNRKVPTGTSAEKPVRNSLFKQWETPWFVGACLDSTDLLDPGASFVRFRQVLIATPDGFFTVGMFTFVSYALCLALPLLFFLPRCAGLFNCLVYAWCVSPAPPLLPPPCRGWSSPGRPRWMFASVLVGSRAS